MIRRAIIATASWGMLAACTNTKFKSSSAEKQEFLSRTSIFSEATGSKDQSRYGAEEEPASSPLCGPGVTTGGSTYSIKTCPQGFDYYDSAYGTQCGQGTCWASHSTTEGMDGAPYGYPQYRIACSSVSTQTYPISPVSCTPNVPVKINPVPVSYECTTYGGGPRTVLSSRKISIELWTIGSHEKRVCTLASQTIRDNLLNSKVLEASGNCPAHLEGHYSIRLIADDDSKSNLMIYGHSSAVHVRKDENGILQVTFPPDISKNRSSVVNGRGTGSNILIHYDGNPAYGTDPGPGLPPLLSDGSKCDSTASPLVIQLAEADMPHSPLELTSPQNGVLFDLLGLNSLPAPFAKKSTAWLAPPSRMNTYFVVLPDERGRVNGIDQMFGNNTRGPDGAFAANGYAALAKHEGLESDGTVDESAIDGLIDRYDPVFKRLRLWADHNGDGEAQSSELFSFEAKKIESIDLNYDPSYAEVDRFGNEIQMKSVIRTTDGALHVIFDIWFRYF